MVDIIDLSWAAGLYEGEGSVFLKGTRSHYEIKNLPSMQLTMIDRDIIERFAFIVGFGRITTYTQKSGTVLHRWESQDRARVPGLLMTFYPWLGERRRSKVREVLAGWQPYGYDVRSVRPGTSTAAICVCGKKKDRHAKTCRECYRKAVV